HGGRYRSNQLPSFQAGLSGILLVHAQPASSRFGLGWNGALDRNPRAARRYRIAAPYGKVDRERATADQKNDASRPALASTRRCLFPSQDRLYRPDPPMAPWGHGGGAA